MRKRSKLQIQAARRNGALSLGPLSAAGKAKVALNAITHSLTAKVNIISTEDKPSFNHLLQSFIADFSPQTDPEFLCVEEMAAAKWKIRRAWALETARLDLQLDLDTAAVDEKYENAGHATRTTLAWTTARPALEAFHRYEAQLLRKHDHAYRLLRDLQQSRVDAESAVENQSKPIQHQHLPEIQNKPEQPHVDLP